RFPQWEAVLASKAGDRNRAEDSYRLAIQLNPEHFAPYSDLATFYERRGETEKALRYYRKALALNPLDEGLKKDVSQIEKTTAAEDQK
ncbi:MAG TPA: tetratricopeptide repeat protein, partial [Gemmatimonadales bacterium]|nr:tetratricopeptide repeat protein [Gemmatimonadales bacterium]